MLILVELAHFEHNSLIFSCSPFHAIFLSGDIGVSKTISVEQVVNIDFWAIPTNEPF